MIKKIEKHFQWEFTKAVKIILLNQNKKFNYHKISDESRDSKPYDCFLMHNEQGWWMELKYHKTHTSFAFDKVEPHQIKALENCKLSWNKWYLIIWINLWRKKWEQFVCIFDIDTWLDIVKNAERKSIKVEDMKEKCDFYLEKDYQGFSWKLWNLTEFLITPEILPF